MDITTEPYRSVDLYRPKDEGRSLHDDACHFYMSAMGLSTPLVRIPDSDDINKAISFVTTHTTDLRSRQIVYDLRSTIVTDLWPDGVVPLTKEGQLWKVANEPVDDEEKKAKKVNEKKKETGKVVGKTTVSPKNNRGRKKGAKKWGNIEVAVLLDAVESVLPAGKEQWEKVSMQCYQNHKDWIRSGESCKNKFEKMAFMKRPTGTAEISINVILRSKGIKEKISSKEVIGFCEENDSDFECFDVEENLNSSSHGKSLSSANLSDTTGEVKRPETKKQKSAQLAEAIKDLGDEQKEAALGLQTAIQRMAYSISGSNSNNNTDDRSDERLSNLESELSSVKKDVSNVNDKLDSILRLLNNSK